ncbi:MAG: hypothetical protein CTY19_11900 [Methylomonas sp.]|jgi:hypothetical protein|nr:MAG: hypothetical protein CTY19_11900 [Methylomonas sp.]
MKVSNTWKTVFLLTSLVFNQTAFAETPAEEAEKKCVKPKFRDFTPAHQAEATPGSDIIFHINRHADPLHVKATAKNLPIPIKVVDKKTFYYVSGKLPAELQDGFARIHVEAKGNEGDCIGQDGWLLKIKTTTDAAKPSEASNSAALESKLQ